LPDRLALAYFELGWPGEAEDQWRQALMERAEYQPAWLGLVELYLRQGRWADMEQIAGRMEGNGKATQATNGTLEACYHNGQVLRARCYLGWKEFGLARALLEELISRVPQDLLAWVFLSYTLLQEGKDLPAAERALRQILALDAGNSEAGQNLAVLLKSR
jgi:Tfp pilus assembly protein PilF